MMNYNGHFSSGQSGFLRLHSTVTCSLKNTDDWYNGMDLEKLVGLVFIGRAPSLTRDQKTNGREDEEETGRERGRIIITIINIFKVG